MRLARTPRDMCQGALPLSLRWQAWGRVAMVCVLPLAGLLLASPAQAQDPTLPKSATAKAFKATPGQMFGPRQKLDKSQPVGPIRWLKSRLDTLRSDSRFAFMFGGISVKDNMAAILGRLFRIPANGKPITIIDLSGIPTEVLNAVVSVVCRMSFDFGLWSKGTMPILLVCEEAHRYVPAERDAHKSSVGKILGRIAKEGRKYGISLGLITQRPSDLAEGVLSQCGTIIAMRLNNDRDQAFVKAAMPEGARGFLDTIPALRNRECIICGEGVSIPIRVAMDDLEEFKRPASSDPLFSELWQQTGGEEEIVSRVVKRWRSQGK